MMTEAPPLPITFVFLATDRDGRRRYVESRGATMNAARYALEVQGFTQAEIVQDDFDQLLARVHNSGAFDGMSLQDRVEFQRKSALKTGSSFILMEILKANWVMILLLGWGVVTRATGRNPTGVFSWCVYAVAAGFVLLMFRGLIPMRLYNQLLEARAWYRWDEAQRIIGTIRSLRWLIGSIVPDYDLRFTEAKVLASKGELEAGLAWVRPLEDDPAFNRQLFLGLLAGVYEVADRRAERLDCAEKAFAMSPDSPTSIIDFTIALMDARDDVVRARATLERLDRNEVKDAAIGFYEFAWGRIHLLEGDYTAAVEALARGVAGQDHHAGNPIAQAARREFQGYHAVALKKLGRKFEAEEEMGKVVEFLEATRHRKLLRLWVEA